MSEGSRELIQQATNLHVRLPCICELRYTDVHKRDFGNFNGLLGSAYVQEKSWDSLFPIEIRDSKDTRDSSFSAKSSRHFESRSSLHVSDLAALTICLDHRKDHMIIYFLGVGQWEKIEELNHRKRR